MLLEQVLTINFSLMVAYFNILRVWLWAAHLVPPWTTFSCVTQRRVGCELVPRNLSLILLGDMLTIHFYCLTVLTALINFLTIFFNKNPNISITCDKEQNETQQFFRYFNKTRQCFKTSIDERICAAIRQIWQVLNTGGEALVGHGLCKACQATRLSSHIRRLGLS